MIDVAQPIARCDAPAPAHSGHDLDLHAVEMLRDRQSVWFG